MKAIREIKVGKKLHKFFDIKDAGEIIYSRFVLAEIETMYIRFGLSREFLKGIATLLKKLSREEKDFNKLQDDIMKIALNVEGRLGLLAETKQFEKLATIYYKLENEPDEYLESWAQKKIDIWNTSPKDRDFFLSEVIQYTNKLSNISMKDILATLKASQLRLDQLPTL